MEQPLPCVSSLRHHHKRECTKHTVISVVFIFIFNYMLTISDWDSSIIQNTFHIISSFKLYLCATYCCWQKKIIIPIKHTGLDYDILTGFWDPGLLPSLNSLIHHKKEYYNLAHKDYSSEYYINGLENKRIKIRFNLSSFLAVKYRSWPGAWVPSKSRFNAHRQLDGAGPGTNQTIPANPVSQWCWLGYVSHRLCHLPHTPPTGSSHTTLSFAVISIMVCQFIQYHITLKVRLSVLLPSQENTPCMKKVAHLPEFGKQTHKWIQGSKCVPTCPGHCPATGSGPRPSWCSVLGWDTGLL